MWNRHTVSDATAKVGAPGTCSTQTVYLSKKYFSPRPQYFFNTVFCGGLLQGWNLAGRTFGPPSVYRELNLPLAPLVSMGNSPDFEMPEYRD
jgi:hypothetical protein